MKPLRYKDFVITVTPEHVDDQTLYSWKSAHPEHGEQCSYFYVAEFTEALEEALAYVEDFIARTSVEARFKRCFQGCTAEYGLIPTVWGLAQWIDRQEELIPLSLKMLDLAVAIEENN